MTFLTVLTHAVGVVVIIAATYIVAVGIRDAILNRLDWLARFVRKNAGTSHSYALDGARIPGVTTVIGILDKPALVNWAARETAIYADENWDKLAAMRSGDRIQLLEGPLQHQPQGRREGQPDPRPRRAARPRRGGRRPAEIRSQGRGLRPVLDAWDLTTVATETPVCHTEWAYGGTFDLIARSPGSGRR